MKPLIIDPVLVDIFKIDIVPKVEAEAIARGICPSIRFFQGPVEELEKELQNLTIALGLPEYEGDARSKFPCIYLLQDFDEYRGNNSGYYSEDPLPLIAIMALSTQNATSAERYEQTFKPVLYPIDKLLKKYIAQCGKIIGQDPDAIKHIKSDKLFYGRREFGTTVSDFIDAIEWKKTELKVFDITRNVC